MVEVEYYNVDHRVKAPDDIFITQQVKTDKKTGSSLMQFLGRAGGVLPL